MKSLERERLQEISSRKITIYEFEITEVSSSCNIPSGLQQFTYGLAMMSGNHYNLGYICLHLAELK